jgi:hypothetical protein
MTEPNSSPEIPADETAPAENPAAEAPESTQTPETTDPLTAALAEVAHWKDIAYRSAAELDNFRKRSAREAQETRAYANADILRSLLPIIDNFEMGLEAARAESEKSMIFMGLSMVQRQLQDFLRDFGVQEIERSRSGRSGTLGNPCRRHDPAGQPPWLQTQGPPSACRHRRRCRPCQHGRSRHGVVTSPIPTIIPHGRQTRLLRSPWRLTRRLC